MVTAKNFTLIKAFCFRHSSISVYRYRVLYSRVLRIIQYSLFSTCSYFVHSLLLCIGSLATSMQHEKEKSTTHRTFKPRLSQFYSLPYLDGSTYFYKQCTEKKKLKTKRIQRKTKKKGITIKITRKEKKKTRNISRSIEFHFNFGSVSENTR